MRKGGLDFLRKANYGKETGGAIPLAFRIEEYLVARQKEMVDSVWRWMKESDWRLLPGFIQKRVKQNNMDCRRDWLKLVYLKCHTHKMTIMPHPHLSFHAT